MNSIKSHELWPAQWRKNIMDHATCCNSTGFSDISPPLAEDITSQEGLRSWNIFPHSQPKKEKHPGVVISLSPFSLPLPCFSYSFVCFVYPSINSLTSIFGLICASILHMGMVKNRVSFLTSRLRHTLITNWGRTPSHSRTWCKTVLLLPYPAEF